MNDDKKKKEEVKKEDDGEDLEKKCREALQKLKSVFSYTKDYKFIIEEYRKQSKK